MAINLPYSRSFLVCFFASVLFVVLATLHDSSPFHNGHHSKSKAHVRRDEYLTTIPNNTHIHSHKRSQHVHGHNSKAHRHALERREDYTCASGRPCGNGACCGESGFCGFGPTYCGTGCSSNCDATAPCGQYAAKPGATCPLNTCCSQHGFCGTTEEFCDAKCQSNCELHPKPSAGGGQVLDRVIGYYESWSARKSCHKIAPTDLPLDALTHLNYAFAYIDPQSFALTTMDSQTPESLFKEVADVKKFNSRLEVWISVGGWSFSDNNTVTQPVFGNLARTAANRRTFANNVLNFLNQYGYDGIDLDWEYPGAPDRGGKDDDTKNYVELVRQLRATFDASGRKLGITFTAPSSYWYLRWFDLPGMLKYVDWINVMTYDLHGTWDSENPIGNIVQGHTNLTEIEYALELFWRVKIPPSKVYMGFGFYGRSFQLSDLSCSTPGCPFKGGAEAGPCSDTSGILMYYEIMSLIKQHPELTPIYDKAAGVKYLVFNKDQWVSYDDAETFKQKKEWANNIGLGGSLIWASDADDDKYSAHSGLVGKEIKHVDVEAMTQRQTARDNAAVAQSLIGQNGQDCHVIEKCLPEDGSKGSGCDSGFEVNRGWEKGKCSKNEQRPICCPIKTAPKEGGCRWRGHASECNGQCHAGETLVFKSSWGGSPAEGNGNTRKCTRGVKAFCCDAGDWKRITELCYWTKCGEQCPIGRKEISQRNQRGDFGCGLSNYVARYCCRSPVPLTDCQWRTGNAFDCVEAKCHSDEVQIDSHPGGSGKFLCSWGRLQVDCCKTITPPPPSPLKCGSNLCNLRPGFCTTREDEDGSSDLSRRDVEEYDDFGDIHTLEKRGGADMIFNLIGLARAARPRRRALWPSRGTLFNTVYRRQNVLPLVIRMRTANDCPETRVESVRVDTSRPQSEISALLAREDAETEHAEDRQIIPYVVQAMNAGVMRNSNGESQRLPGGSISTEILLRVLFQDSLPAGLPGVGNNDANREIREPATRIIQAGGNTRNPDNFIPTQAQINAMKGQIMGFSAPMGEGEFLITVRDAATGLDSRSTNQLLTTFNVLIGVFDYLQRDDVSLRRARTQAAIAAEFGRTENLDPAMRGAGANYRLIVYRHRRWVESFAQSWLSDHIEAFEAEIFRQEPANAESLLNTLSDLKNKISDMTIPED